MVENDEKIRFSFEHYDTNRNDYCISKWTEGQIRKALERLKDLNTKSFTELQRQGRVYHFNEVDWSKTKEKQGFRNKIVDKLAPFHFALLDVSGQKTRVYGAYYAGTFYIVWFDLNHTIWPTPLQNT